MQLFSKILFLFIVLSCHVSQQTEKSGSQEELLPYFSVYSFGWVADTVLANGTFLKFFANKDTSDHHLYIKYGNRKFDSVYVMDNVVPISHCSTPDLFYATDNSIALISSCINSTRMIFLPLNRRDSIKELLTPLYINLNQNVLLVEDYERYSNNNSNNTCIDTLTLADLDLINQKQFYIGHMVSGYRNLCIDSVYIKKGILFLRSECTTPCDGINDPGDKLEQISIPWIR